jgi:glutamate formiminotransferase
MCAELGMTSRADGAIVECVANVSEGRRTEVIAILGAAVSAVAGVRLLDVHTDGDHHRSVLTFAGPIPAVEEAAYRLAETTVTQIDLREHRGTHPRIGALDVLPFVPLLGSTMSDCVALAHRVGQRIADELNVPIYYYAQAAMRAERRQLVNVRRGEYEELARTISMDAGRAPDAGPRVLGAAGATAVGARPPLIAFNMHLRTEELEVAHAIARAVRESSGGLTGVQALGLPTTRPGIVQVSMNLVLPEVTALHTVVAFVRGQAAKRGVETAESELVGLLPAQAALAAAGTTLGLPTLDGRQVIEIALAEALALGPLRSDD